MASEPRDPAREARDRVALRQDRETRALTEFQRAECERDAERQNRAVENSLANQAKLEADKKIALAEHDKLLEAGQRSADAKAHSRPRLRHDGRPAGAQSRPGP